MSEAARPDGYTDEVRDYLDDLRLSGVTNMFGAGPYLRDEFGCDKQTSWKWLDYWMHEEHR